MLSLIHLSRAEEAGKVAHTFALRGSDDSFSMRVVLPTSEGAFVPSFRLCFRSFVPELRKDGDRLTFGLHPDRKADEISVRCCPGLEVLRGLDGEEAAHAAEAAFSDLMRPVPESAAVPWDDAVEALRAAGTLLGLPQFDLRGTPPVHPMLADGVPADWNLSEGSERVYVERRAMSSIEVNRAFDLTQKLANKLRMSVGWRLLVQERCAPDSDLLPLLERPRHSVECPQTAHARAEATSRIARLTRDVPWAAEILSAA